MVISLKAHSISGLLCNFDYFCDDLGHLQVFVNFLIIVTTVSQTQLCQRSSAV
jgi:hypothetical protein